MRMKGVRGLVWLSVVKEGRGRYSHVRTLKVNFGLSLDVEVPLSYGMLIHGAVSVCEGDGLGLRRAPDWWVG